jgi:hypothetical protein
MKAVVLLSKTFFSKHPKAGKATGFRNKILMSISDIEFACDCGWTGLKEELSSVCNRFCFVSPVNASMRYSAGIKRNQIYIRT